MQYPNSFGFTQEAFDFEAAMDIDSSPGSTLPGLTPHLPGTWPPFDPVPDPVDHSGVSKLGWEIMQPSPLAGVISPVEMDLGNLYSAPMPMFADTTQVSESSFAMNTLTNHWNFTNNSSIQPVMVDCPMEDVEMADFPDFQAAEIGILSNIEDPMDISADYVEENRENGTLFATESPWDQPTPNPNHWSLAPRVKAGTVHQRVQQFEQIQQTVAPNIHPNANLNRNPKLMWCSPDATPQNSPDFRAKSQLKSLGSHAMVNGNNSNDQDYNHVEHLNPNERHENFISDINNAQNNGILEQSSPQKTSIRLLMVENFTKASSINSSSNSSMESLFYEKESTPKIQWDNTHENHSSENSEEPHPNFGADSHVTGTGTIVTVKEDCGGHDFSRAQLLHPTGVQPHCNPHENTLAQSGLKTAQVVSRPDSAFSIGSLQIPTLQDPDGHDAKDTSPLSAQPEPIQDNQVLQGPWNDQSDHYTHVSAELEPQDVADFNVNDCMDEPSPGLGIAYPEEMDQECPPQPIIATPAMDLLQTFQGSDFGVSSQLLPDSYWKPAEIFQAAHGIAWQMRPELQMAPLAPQLNVFPHQNYQQLNNNTAYNCQYQDLNNQGFPPQVPWASTGNMPIQPQMQGFMGTIQDSYLGISYLENLQPAPVQMLPYQSGPSHTLQNSQMAPTSHGVVKTLPDELFKDSPKTSRISTGGATSQSNLAEQEAIPRSYFVDPNYLGVLENNEDIQKPMDEFLDTTELQELEKFANELELELKQQLLSQKPVDPIVTPTTANSIQKSSVFLTSARTPRAPRAKRRQNGQMSKPRARHSTANRPKPPQVTSAVRNNSLQNRTNQAVQEAEQAPGIPVQPEVQTPVQGQTTVQRQTTFQEDSPVQRLNTVQEETPVQRLNTVQEESPVQGQTKNTPVRAKGKRQRKGKEAFNYDGIIVPQEIIEIPEFHNVAKNEDDHRHESQLISVIGTGEWPIGRIKYQRNNLEVLQEKHDNVVYERNASYGANKPYQHEFSRTEIDPESKEQMIETRSALCAYCEEINFFELKNSCYSQHMSHSHGIYADSYLTPDPLHSGMYRVWKKASEKRKTKPRVRTHEGVVCPVCYDVVEVRCWTSTSATKPLSNYLRHFKENHRVDKRKETFFDGRATISGS